MITAGASGEIAARFRRLIETFGPIPVARFMGESNALYYSSRDPLGAPQEAGGGDFVTAPEISQMFGELAGLWLADGWHRAHRPAEPIYAEFGPGRGTLARDALRAMAGAGLHPQVHLVEGSPALQAIQQTALPQAHLHVDASSLPESGPLLIIANEFLDALPVRQLVRTESGWHERMVAWQDGRFTFAAGPQPMDRAVPAAFVGSTVGTIIETNPGAAALVQEIASRLTRQGGAALFFDYGHLTMRTGSTLQAVRSHRKVDPLACPGDADMTAHVDFAVLADIAKRAGCRVQTGTQGAWLEKMGIAVRAEALIRAAPGRRADIECARTRLCGSDEMGTLFKVMAITGPQWPAGSGFEALHPAR